MTAADRARRYRQRQRRNREVVAVECHFDLVDAMIVAGLISAEASEDKAAISAAAAEILRRWQISVTRDASNHFR